MQVHRQDSDVRDRAHQLAHMSRALQIEAVVALGIARLASRRIGFGKIARRMGWEHDALRADADICASQAEAAASVGKALRWANRIWKFRDACLADAMAAKWMLCRRRVPATLYIGARILGSAAHAPRVDPDKHIALHAWVMAGAVPVIGKSSTPHVPIGRYR